MIVKMTGLFEAWVVFRHRGPSLASLANVKELFSSQLAKAANQKLPRGAELANDRCTGKNACMQKCVQH
jgi:hypothetical protein